jgi:prepilin-type N-terminal cleavage/methylation domain-containing protein
MKAMLKRFKARLAKSYGFTLIEVIFAVAIITVVGSAFATALISGSRASQKNNDRMKEREVVVANIDDKIASTKTYTAADGYDTTEIKLYKSGESSPYETKDCYVIKNGGYEGYAKKAD